MENNLDYLLFSTEEEMIHEIVDNILKTQDKIIEKQNLTKLNNNSGIGLKINEIKKNIDNYSNIIHQKILEIKEKEKIPILTLEIRDRLSQINILKINPTGLENGRRKKKDGFTYFGYETNEEDIEEQIDYLLLPNQDLFREFDDRFLR